MGAATRSRMSFRGLTSLAVSLWGVFAVHTLSYWITHRAAHARAQHLAATGHSHWDVAVPVAVGGLLIALLISFYSGWVSRSGRSLGLPDAGSRGLAFLTIAGFATMEMVERALSGAGASSLATEPAFWIGIAASIVIACINALLLRGAHLVGAALAGVTDTARRREIPSPASGVAITQDFLFYVCWTRGPPFSTR